ncbi:MAG: phospholipid carrier-dependent glycosyltransferase [Euzebyales bacterium]|nr:phospholipid carrier-dependent glycosyltransferase [Euzebyales bacterium]
MAVDTSARPAPPVAGDAGDGGRGGRLRRLLLPLVLVGVAGALRFWMLDHPPRIYFDEVYYAKQANEYLTRGVEEGFAVHPPLGKWLIAAGIAATRFDSFGWRLSSAVAGTLTVLVTYLLGLRLFRRRAVAALAAFLLAVDGLAFTMSRISMLDVFLGLFVAVGVWLLLLDRDALWAGAELTEADPQRPLPRRSRRWRWLAGLALGLALAVKWSAVPVIAGAALFVLASELLWRRRVAGSARTAWPRVVASILATLVVLPLVVYVASYAGWFANFSQSRLGMERCPQGPCEVSEQEVVGTWWREQGEIARFHRELEAEHPYRSDPLSWLVLGRPVAYYYESCDDEKSAKGKCAVERGNVEEILGIGNPAIWWLALGAYPLVGWYAVRRRDWRAATVLGFLLVQYLPFLVARLLPFGHLNRPNFLFYLLPGVPFLCLTLAYAAWRLAERRSLRWVPAAVAALSVAVFVFFYPVYVGMELSDSVWRLRMWFPSWI